MNNLRKIRKSSDVIKYLREKNIDITFYKLKKLFIERIVSGFRFKNNIYFYLDDIDRYFEL